jgi:hypothetical protein
LRGEVRDRKSGRKRGPNALKIWAQWLRHNGDARYGDSTSLLLFPTPTLSTFGSSQDWWVSRLHQLSKRKCSTIRKAGVKQDK